MRSPACHRFLCATILSVWPVAVASTALAQTMGGFQTRPWTPPPLAVAPSAGHGAPIAPAPDVAPAPRAPAPIKPTPPDADGLPLVMFKACENCGPRPAAAVAQTGPAAAPTPAPLPAPTPAPVAPVILASVPEPEPAPSVIALAPPTPPQRLERAARAEPSPRDPRGPFRRIWEGTRDAVRHDVPEALADALPWVDKARKDRPLDAVLAEVADELGRASASDPEWAAPAEDEIRTLAARLRALPEPPPARDAVAHASPLAQDGDVRPFRPRPIWPGASARLEPQSRPLALATGTPRDMGPAATGDRRDWRADAEDAEPPAPAVAPLRAPAAKGGPARANRRR
jgi:hypothetical protein